MMYSQFFPNAQHTDKIENFIQACMNGDMMLVQALIADGVNINGINEKYGDTGLSQAALKGHVAIVNLLLTYSITQYSKDLALIFATQRGHVEIIDKLLQAGADVNADADCKFGYYNPPLHQAIAQNELDAFIKLINAENIDLNLEDKDNRIPLLLAAFNGRLEMVKQLIEKGVNPNIANSKGWTAKSLAEQKGHTQITEYLDSLKPVTKGLIN